MGGARLARGGEDGGEIAGRIGQAGQDRGEGDTGGDAGIGEDADRAQALSRWGDTGLEAGGERLIHRRDAHADHDGHPPRRLREHVEVADDEWPARDDAERRACAREDLDAAAGQPVTTLGRLVRIGGGADRDRLAAPGSAMELRAQHLDDVDLHAHACPVALVRGAVGAAFETAHVTECAAMRAAHVRVEAPVEAHPGHPVERRATRLLAIGGAHDRQV